ncbi:MAG: hypothetical protein Sylvanvirus32_4 [Sylvanvirus sp.]|uniref:Uncharacterized protein n=1 Tax=Sylvanvirus sp. TaxID=2487774 RepID=A0A3G5AJ21_9VIRU|nr:MAG: hypothetical protein Sylvanvirus32_4 [Sylvanvirus sp.]
MNVDKDDVFESLRHQLSSERIKQHACSYHTYCSCITNPGCTKRDINTRYVNAKDTKTYVLTFRDSKKTQFVKIPLQLISLDYTLEWAKKNKDPMTQSKAYTKQSPFYCQCEEITTSFNTYSEITRIQELIPSISLGDLIRLGLNLYDLESAYAVKEEEMETSKDLSKSKQNDIFLRQLKSIANKWDASSECTERLTSYNSNTTLPLLGAVNDGYGCVTDWSQWFKHDKGKKNRPSMWTRCAERVLVVNFPSISKHKTKDHEHVIPIDTFQRYINKELCSKSIAIRALKYVVTGQTASFLKEVSSSDMEESITYHFEEPKLVIDVLHQLIEEENDADSIWSTEVQDVLREIQKPASKSRTALFSQESQIFSSISDVSEQYPMFAYRYIKVKSFFSSEDVEKLTDRASTWKYLLGQSKFKRTWTSLPTQTFDDNTWKNFVFPYHKRRFSPAYFLYGVMTKKQMTKEYGEHEMMEALADFYYKTEDGIEDEIEDGMNDENGETKLETKDDIKELEEFNISGFTTSLKDMKEFPPLPVTSETKPCVTPLPSLWTSISNRFTEWVIDTGFDISSENNELSKQSKDKSIQSIQSTNPSSGSVQISSSTSSDDSCTSSLSSQSLFGYVMSAFSRLVS